MPCACGCKSCQGYQFGWVTGQVAGTAWKAVGTVRCGHRALTHPPEWSVPGLAPQRRLKRRATERLMVRCRSRSAKWKAISGGPEPPFEAEWNRKVCRSALAAFRQMDDTAGKVAGPAC